MKVQGSSDVDTPYLTIEEVKERKNLPVENGGVMASTSCGFSMQGISPVDAQVVEKTRGNEHSGLPSHVDQSDEGTTAISPIKGKPKTGNFQGNGEIVHEDETDRITNIPSISNSHTLDERPSSYVSETDEHLGIVKEVEAELQKDEAFVPEYDNVAYVPDELEAEPRLFIIDDGYLQHGSKGTCIRYESQVDKKERRRQFVRQFVTLFGGCFNVFLGLGFPFSLGVLFVDWLEDFQTTRAETAVIQSTSTGLTFMGGLVNGFLIQRFGIRAVLCSGSLVASAGLFATWFSTGHIFTVVSVGVVMGSGCSMVYLGNNVNVTLAFRDPRAKGFALALLTSSGGLGSLLFPPILTALKTEFGWRGALLIMSGVYLNVCVSGLLVTSALGVPRVALVKNNTDGKAASKYRRLLNPLYGAYLMCGLIGFGSITSTVLTAVDFGLSKGLSEETGLMFLLIINGTSTGMRLMAGVIQMIPGVKTFHVFCLSVVVSGSSLIAISWADSYGMIAACYTVYGLAAGGMVSTYAMVILQVVGEDMYAISMGLGGAVTGTSNTTLGILMGTLYDLTGSYSLPFRIFGSVAVGAASFPVIIQCLKSIGTHKSVNIAHQ